MIPAFTRVSSQPPHGPSEAVLPASDAARGQPAFVATMERASERVGFGLLLVAMVMLLFRPADLFESWADLSVYENLLAACLAASLFRVARVLAPRSLRANALVVGSLLLVVGVGMSHLAHLNTYDARVGGLEMLKACVVLLLVVGHVDSRAKLEVLVSTLAVGVLGIATLSLLHFHGVIDLPALTIVQQRSVEAGQSDTVLRLCAVGLFNDPNDLAVILVVAIAVCGYWLLEGRLGMWRFVVIVPIGVLVYALYQTHSRGGLLSALATGFVFLLARVGWKSAIPVAVLAIPALALVVSRRQTSIGIDNPDDTFQTRLGLWSDSLSVFRDEPLFGVGQGKLADLIGQVSHNSFLHAFAEMGLVGGLVFLGMFYLTARGLWRVRPVERDMARMRSLVLATVVGYAVGLVSLSRCYTVPTQLVLGMGIAYLVIAARGGWGVLPRWGWSVAGRVIVVGACFLLATHLFVKIMIARGGG